MVRFPAKTISAAFEQHFAKYAEYAWTVPHHVEMWNTARRAFVHDDLQAFENLYEELRKRWQVFRGKKRRPSAEQLFQRLKRLDPSLASRQLSALRREDVAPLWDVIKAMSGIKRLRSGPSIMATSKFLHFWNPRLFVIVDMAAMWNWVFEHAWIWNLIKVVHPELSGSLPQRIREDADYGSNLGKYLSILVWCGELAKANPSIVSTFDGHIRRSAEQATAMVPPDLRTYGAAAIEWFLLGAVELPPV